MKGPNRYPLIVVSSPATVAEWEANGTYPVCNFVQKSAVVFELNETQSRELCEMAGVCHTHGGPNPPTHPLTTRSLWGPDSTKTKVDQNKPLVNFA